MGTLCFWDRPQKDKNINDIYMRPLKVCPGTVLQIARGEVYRACSGGQTALILISALPWGGCRPPEFMYMCIYVVVCFGRVNQISIQKGLAVRNHFGSSRLQVSTLPMSRGRFEWPHVRCYGAPWMLRWLRPTLMVQLLC